ncbi:MAG: hypothetical protein QOD89_1869, partial [Bradyrhizobium sp.]|nr:hypothetical protein [Bradyrhizobium sp.]
YSVVRDNGEDPRLTHGCCRRGIGRHRRALWAGGHRPKAQSLTSHILLNGQIQGARHCVDQSQNFSGRKIFSATSTTRESVRICRSASPLTRSLRCATASTSPREERGEVEKETRCAARPGTNSAHYLASGFSPASISARRGSRNGGSASFSPSVWIGSSVAKPGPSVAISNRMPFGSRKYRLRK